MDENTKDSNQPTTNAEKQVKRQRYSLVVRDTCKQVLLHTDLCLKKITISDTLKALLQTYSEKYKEVILFRPTVQDAFAKVCVAEEALYTHMENTNLNLRMISLDSIVSLDNYSQYLTLENDFLKLERAYNVQNRLAVIGVDELSALESEIMTNHNAELEFFDMKDRFEARRAAVSRLREQLSAIDREILFE